MKKLQTVFAAVSLLLATSAFAVTGPEKVSPIVKTAFEKSFTGASNVSWEKNDDFYFAHFKLNTRDMDAAYNENGELLGMSRVIASSELPLNVSRAITDKYPEYTVNNTVTEISYEGQTNYYVNVTNSRQLLKLKCAGNGEISIDKKTKK
jgi:hypothetical protein